MDTLYNRNGRIISRLKKLYRFSTVCYRSATQAADGNRLIVSTNRFPQPVLVLPPVSMVTRKDINYAQIKSVA